jgi:hypothetical protein
MRIVGITLTLILILASVDRAAACSIIETERDFRVFREAEIIVRAKIARVEIVPFKLRNNHSIDSARVTFETIEEVVPWKPGRKTWNAHWDTAMFGKPHPDQLSTKVIVGFKSFIQPDGEPGLEVVQQGCGPTSVLPDTRDNLDRVLEAIGFRPEQRERILMKRVSPEE